MVVDVMEMEVNGRGGSRECEGLTLFSCVVLKGASSTHQSETV